MATSIDKTRFNQLIKNFQFKELFNELGWDSVRKKEQIAVENELYNLEAVAEKKGLVVFACFPGNNGKIPDYHIRKKIDSAVTKLYFEHLIIFCDLSQKHQIWQLVVREQGKPTAVRETNYYTQQEPELLFQKLKGLFFSIDDEEKISIVDVKSLIQEQFNANAEKVTKQFYDRFKKEHTSFLNFIKNISDTVDKDWYASLMLNRLMLIYFIQKKGFLDNDKDYLKNRLKATQEKKGKDKFYSFYRNFLLILFHKGLGSCERTPEITKEIGIVPYLNGGLFDVHHIEHKYKDTEIPDEAFEQVFSFFDQYEWHLDTRITATGKDINPDVIGYIFEKYINDRASMGAYYTKEDITDYIGKNCIIPYLFDEVKRSYPKAFNPDTEIWKLLQTDPDKYMYGAVKHGTQHELPTEIEAGINQVSARTAWNKPSSPEYALPTEIWREVVERRRRYTGIKVKIENGELNEINDFITYNLNIRQFAQDVIENTEDPELIKHFYKALLLISILDPTCGSGAFLFAAINILEPLYEACIQRMENFVADANNSLLERGQRGVSKYKSFYEILNAVKSPEHPNLQYFIYKNIILKNIYGVDIMHEAVEIAKLRLFLKLVATVDVDYKKKNLGLEPLPDIDFNIRAGNTLVGFAKLEEVEKVVKGSFDATFLKKEIDAIKEQAEMVKMAYEHFKDSQMIIDSPAMSGAKQDLEERLRKLNDTLNIYLSQLYGIDVERKPKGFEKWKTTHQPFHWFAEFYQIIHDKGGFDVIMGNPPYVALNKIEYSLKNFETIDANNLYNLVQERSLQISKDESCNGFIVMLNICFSKDYEIVRKYIVKRCSKVFISSFDNIPDGLFSSSGKEESKNTNKVVSQRVTICIYKKEQNNQTKEVSTSKFYRWNREFRNFLFEAISYSSIIRPNPINWSALSNNISVRIFNTLENKSNQQLGVIISKTGNEFLQLGATPRYFISAVPFEMNRSGLIELRFNGLLQRIVAECVLNSNLFYWYWRVSGDGFHLTKSTIQQMPIPASLVTDSNKLKILSKNLADSKDLCTTQKLNKGKIVYNVNYNKVPSIIDEIDKVLAQHYGFTDEELDFIINYDIKYRMGKELDAED